MEPAKPIIAKEPHSLSIAAAAQYSANKLHFPSVQELSVWHCQSLRNTQRNDEHNESDAEKVFRGISHISSPSLSSKVHI